MKRKALRLFLIGLFGAAAFVAFLLTRPVSPINRQNFDKIEVGMTMAEVEAIIGLPPGDYSTGKVEIVDAKSCIVDAESVSAPPVKAQEFDEEIAPKLLGLFETGFITRNPRLDPTNIYIVTSLVKTRMGSTLSLVRGGRATQVLFGFHWMIWRK